MPEEVEEHGDDSSEEEEDVREEPRRFMRQKGKSAWFKDYVSR